jgi:hypothetical protein
MRHAMDPDHVIAVATIATRERSPWTAAVIGALWGIGHTITIATVGGAIILFEIVIPPRLGLAMEFSVGIMLVLLGVASLAGLTRRVTAALTAGRAGDASVHAHEDYVHDHPHGHGPGGHGHADQATPISRLDRLFGRMGTYQVMRPVVVGLVHGLAGSAAVALLVLATIREPLWALGYLLLFGIGTIAGMMVTTAAISVPFAYTAGRLVTVHRYLGVATGLLSIGFGLFLAYQIGLVDGLFTGNPQWEPK